MYIDKKLAKEIIRLLENYQEVIDNLKEFANDMAMDEYELKPGEHWITLPNKARMVINAEKKIVCGLEGKYNGLTIEELKEVQKGESEGYTTPIERKRKIESVKIDFDRDNILPELNREDLAEIGKTESKPVLFKKSTLDRNEREHKDIFREEYNLLIAEALYNKDAILPEKRGNPAYYHFIKKWKEIIRWC